MVGSKSFELLARDAELRLPRRASSGAVALHLGELALELARREAGAPLAARVAPPRRFSTFEMRLFSFWTILSIVFLLRRISSSVVDHLARGRLRHLDVDLLAGATSSSRPCAPRAGPRFFLSRRFDLVDEADDAAVGLLLVELLARRSSASLMSVLDADLVLPELLAELDDLADGDRRVEDGALTHLLAVPRCAWRSRPRPRA